MIQTMVSAAYENSLKHRIALAVLDLLCKRQIFSYLNNDSHLEIPRKEVYKCLTNMLLCLAYEQIFVAPFTNSDSSSNKYSNLFSTMYKRVERNLQIINDTEEPTVIEDQTTTLILNFFWNMSDRTIIVPWVLGIGLTKAMLSCLEIVGLPLYATQSIINIIHNISRHDDGADEINKFDGLHVLKNIPSENSNALDDDTNLVISMAIALLSTPNQIRSDNKGMNKILNQLLQATIEAAEVSFRKTIFPQRYNSLCTRKMRISNEI
ncbi:unnamed protein product [Rotaria magnacalcarata]